ncbi:hypothetical protein ES319_A13G114100v1 [Gossypium barbadense]|uniref:Disease resistance N-terminal domain-containing protein n=3 Tax=Gossypium TaxID=3633 RepID=A0A1U8I8L2_GOSHI|nr:uncharacterized protein LOC107893845 [Gossypium hirsutum]KAB2048450.1 hypothetical protein ES319_A13G114100v1 [Gossypium barbadense]TYG86263.1 hypothetical protein ES288_A13G120400v1 [Gossypium darwinii]
MSSIKAVLLDAERQQHQNKKLRLCMWKLRDIFYDAEDVDDFKCEALRKQAIIPTSASRYIHDLEVASTQNNKCMVSHTRPHCYKMLKDLRWGNVRRQVLT